MQNATLLGYQCSNQRNYVHKPDKVIFEYVATGVATIVGS